MRFVLPLLLAGVCVAQSKRAGFLGAQLAAPAEGAGVRLARVYPDTPAAKAGLQAEDIIVRVGEAEIADVAALAARIRADGAGAAWEVEIVRAGETKKVALTLGVNPRILLEEPDTSPGMLSVKIARDLTYFLGDGQPHERQRLNLFLPATEKKFPIVLWIHAGAWSYGDRSGETALAMRFAERGIGFAPMSYRLSSKFWNEPSAPKDGFKHPAHAEDCAMAFAWLRKRFPGYPLLLAGHSCGAHLGALLAMDPRYLNRHGLALDEIKGVVAIGGGYDLVKYHAILAGGIGGEPGLGKEKADAHLMWIFGDTPAEWIAASPTTYLEGCTMPMLIVSEKGASMKRYTDDFEVAAKAAGVTSFRFRHAPDRTHGQSTPFMSRKEPDPIRDEMIAFLRAHSE